MICLNNSNTTIKRIFSSLDTSFLIKYYSISLALFIALLLTAINSEIHNFSDFFGIIFVTICSILFPFSVLVWNCIVNLFFKNSVIILPIVVMILLKIFKILLLYAFSIFIAPFGIIYIYFKTK